MPWFYGYMKIRFGFSQATKETGPWNEAGMGVVACPIPRGASPYFRGAQRSIWKYGKEKSSGIREAAGLRRVDRARQVNLQLASRLLPNA